MKRELLFELKSIAYLAIRDLKIEFRKKYEIFSILTFSLVSILIFSFSIDPFSKYTNEVLPALLWFIILFSGIFGFSTSFTREKDQETIDALRILPISPQAVLIGKTMYGLSLISIVELVIIPISLIFFNFSFKTNLFFVFIVFLLGTIGLSLIGSMVSGLAMYSESRTIVIPMIMVPLILPIIIPCILLTRIMILTNMVNLIIPEFKIILFALIALFSASIILFEYVLVD